MKYVRMPIEVESPEQLGYDRIRYNLSESSVRDRTLADLGADLGAALRLPQKESSRAPRPRERFAAGSTLSKAAVGVSSRQPASSKHRHLLQ